MRVMVASDNRFYRTQNGNIYSNTLFDYSVWEWYLQVFDEVVIFARVGEIPEKELSRPCAVGPNVCFRSLPMFVGPWQFIRKYYELNALAKQAVEDADAFILFVPGTLSSLLWYHLRRKNIPYAVEVKGDPWDSLAPGCVKSVARPLVRRKMTWELGRQCRYSIAAAYVTEYSLQKRYPARGWSTFFSDVRLPDEAIIGETAFQKRIEKMKAKSQSYSRWCICHVGILEHLYKAPDVLLDAVASCIRKGISVEIVFIGDGRYKAQLEVQAAELGIAENVKFLGMVMAGKDVFDELDRADLFILPSRQEGLPRALVEAMARGLPCIGSTVGGIPELLASEDLVPPGDVEALADKIEFVLSHPGRLEQMSVRNLQSAKKYHADTLNKRRIEFYEKIVEETKKRK